MRNSLLLMVWFYQGICFSYTMKDLIVDALSALTVTILDIIQLKNKDHNQIASG